MPLIEIIILSIGLSMDSFAVSTCTGISQNRFSLITALRFAIILGLAQALMPLIGWWIGEQFSGIIQDYDHWIAFILLAILGLKMILESICHKEDSEQCDCKTNTMSIKTNILMSIATSIDALAVGVSLGLLSQLQMSAISIIFITTVIFSISGLYLGKIFGSRLNTNITNIIGGVILILIGVKILIEHTMF